MRKYLFLITDNYPFGSGEEFIQNEIEFLSKSFKEIYIITGNTKDVQTKKTNKNVIIYRVKKDTLKLLRVLKVIKIDFIKDFMKENKLYKNIKEKINFIYNGYIVRKTILNIIEEKKMKDSEITLYSYWFYAGAYGISKIKNKNIVKISRAHRYDLYLERGIQPFKVEILKNIDMLLSCSKEGKDYLREKYNDYKEKIKYSYLGTLNKNGFKLKRQNYTILSCSYIRPVKRVELIIEGLKEIECNTKNIKWIHIGGGDDLKRIEKIAEKKLKNINFEFLGHLDNKEILNYYRNNDINIFINLSESEGLPVSMMEAQSYGIPIIATNVGGVKEIMKSDTGILLNKDPHPKEIAKAIERIFTLSEVEYIALQKRSYDNWNDNFNGEKNYKEFIENFLKRNKNE